MRRALIVGMTALAVGSLWLSGPGRRGEAQSGFLGASPKSIQFQPVNLSNSVGALNMQKIIHTPKPPSPLGLGNLIHTPSSSTLYQRKVASAPQVNPKQNRFQPNNPKSKYVINPTPPSASSKTLWNFPLNLTNPFNKTPKKK
jgi:hypothetical protein